MLKMIRSNAFKANNEVRPEIYFHTGLNVVMGTDAGNNSIGKSTLLMIIDFVFGGEDYIIKSIDVQEEVGIHSIEFIFNFDSVDYYFSRSTGNFDVVQRCDSTFKPVEEIKLSEYHNFLARKYGLDYEGNSLRSSISRFLRVYGRETLNENEPLKSAIRETQENSIEGMIKLFNKYKSIAEKKKVYEVAKDKESTFKKAKKYNMILSVGNKTDYAKNKERIEELTIESMKLAEESSKGLLEMDSLQASELADIRNKLSALRRQRTLIRSQLKSTGEEKIFNKTTFQKDYGQLLEFFPEVNLQKIEKIESFHRQITSILNKEFKENEANLYSLLEIVNEQINELEEYSKRFQLMPNVNQTILEKYSAIKSELDKLVKANESYLITDELKASKEMSKEAYDELVKKAISEFEAEINRKMYGLNYEIYGGDRTSPQLDISSSTKYSFYTPKDGGTGSKYKGLILFDLAVLDLTNLPLVIHDSVLLKQIEDYALEEILKLYAKSRKQIFIALDKGASYTKESQRILIENTVLVLEPNGKELFGRAWNKTNNNDGEVKNKHEKTEL